MQAPTRIDAVALARGRARKWLRVFLQLVRVLDRLETRHESRLAAALVFLVQRVLGRLETPEPVAAFTPDDSAELLEGEATEHGGTALMTAMALVRPPAKTSRGTREDPVNDELEVLLVLAGSLTHAADDGRFDDPKLTAGQLVKEFSALKQGAAGEVVKVELFPTDFRVRWAGLLESAAKRGDPMRRLSLELSLMKCIHALYAMAIGFRSSSEFESAQGENDAWLALSVGESILKSGRR
jgi:hypothetical protein